MNQQHWHGTAGSLSPRYLQRLRAHPRRRRSTICSRWRRSHGRTWNSPGHWTGCLPDGALGWQGAARRTTGRRTLGSNTAPAGAAGQGQHTDPYPAPLPPRQRDGYLDRLLKPGTSWKPDCASTSALGRSQGLNQKRGAWAAQRWVRGQAADAACAQLFFTCGFLGGGAGCSGIFQVVAGLARGPASTTVRPVALDIYDYLRHVEHLILGPI